jgi:hypothetical protein
MATKMPTDWQPPNGRRPRLRPVPATSRARWAAYVDGPYWALRHGVDLPAGTTLAAHYRAAWMWAADRGWRCSGWRDEEAGVLYLRITTGAPGPAAAEAAA